MGFEKTFNGIFNVSLDRFRSPHSSHPERNRQLRQMGDQSHEVLRGLAGIVRRKRVVFPSGV
jgi:hypothetical protein